MITIELAAACEETFTDLYAILSPESYDWCFIVMIWRFLSFNFRKHFFLKLYNEKISKFRQLLNVASSGKRARVSTVFYLINQVKPTLKMKIAHVRSLQTTARVPNASQCDHFNRKAGKCILSSKIGAHYQLGRFQINGKELSTPQLIFVVC